MRRLRADQRLATFCDKLVGVRLDPDVLGGLTMTYGEATTVAAHVNGVGTLRPVYGTAADGTLHATPGHPVLRMLLPAARPLGRRADTFVAVWVPFPKLQASDDVELTCMLATSDPVATIADAAELPRKACAHALRLWQSGDRPAHTRLAGGVPALDAVAALARTFPDANRALGSHPDGDVTAAHAAQQIGTVADGILATADRLYVPASPSLLASGPTLVLSCRAGDVSTITAAAAATPVTVQVTAGPRLSDVDRRVVAGPEPSS